MSAEQMAALHEQGVKDFLAGGQTDTEGGQSLEPTILPDGMKEFDLWALPVTWGCLEGDGLDAMSFNEQVPGPEIRVRQGDRVRFVLQNQLDQPTLLHFHGLTVPNRMDGVPYVTQDPIMPGGSWTYTFRVVDPPGFYVYHSHFNSTEQVGQGLYGALMVLPKQGSWSYPSFTTDTAGYLRTGAPAKVDQEYTMFLGDGPLGHALNGKVVPGDRAAARRARRLGPASTSRTTERCCTRCTCTDTTSRLSLRTASRSLSRTWPTRGDRAGTTVRRARARPVPGRGRSHCHILLMWNRRACSGVVVLRSRSRAGARWIMARTSCRP